jgi:hypothetical protein
VKKIKRLSIVVLVILLFIPFIRISNTQGSYAGIQNSDEYEGVLKVHSGNWNTYFTDDLEDTLGNLVPLGSSNLTLLFNHWSSITPPHPYWLLKVTSMGIEQTGLLLSPEDNSTITATPVDGTFGWITSSSNHLEWDETWYIVNDTSSFLRQTLNLTRSFSFYTMFSVFLAPTTISWSSLVSEFLAEMTVKGGLYTNIAATAQSDGFLIDIPALGFDNNSAAININVKYNSNGVLSYYKFSYGGNTLVDFIPGNFVPQHEQVPDQYIFVFFGLTAILFAELIFYIYSRKGRK